jgi:ectoine hydroxylase-related dioxygenase (phytanoyl-CoA dioxygenase family)
MAQQIRRMDLSEGSARILGIVDQDGGVIVENFISRELVHRIRAQLGDFAEAFRPGISEGAIKAAFAGGQTKRFSGLISKAPAFAEVVDHDLLHEWATQAFKNDYWINTAQAMIVGPGSQDQYLHRDWGNWPIAASQGPKGPEATVSIMLALSDFTAENGATRVVPGSHKWDDFSREAEPESVVQAVMPAGSALLYTGKTIHGAGANRTEDQWRFGIHLSFCLGQLTPEEALPLTVPWEVAQHCSERVKAMLGYYSIRTFDGGWPILWTKDYRELRDQLDPPPTQPFVTAGASNRLPPDGELAVTV